MTVFSTAWWIWCALGMVCVVGVFFAAVIGILTIADAWISGRSGNDERYEMDMD